MKRSLAFLPAAVDALERRVAPSSAHPAVAAAAKGDHRATHAHVTPALDVEGGKRETFSTGLVQTTHRTIATTGDGVATARDVITNSDGTSEIDTATGTQGDGATTIRINKVFSTGITQDEVDTETSTTAFGKLRGDGTVIPGPFKDGPVVTTQFARVTTQAGLGTQVIVGDSVVGRLGGRVETITNQQVTNFDGTVEQVRIVATHTANPTIDHVADTVTHADGSAVTTTSTIKLLPGSIDGLPID